MGKRQLKKIEKKKQMTYRIW